MFSNLKDRMGMNKKPMSINEIMNMLKAMGLLPLKFELKCRIFTTKIEGKEHFNIAFELPEEPQK